MKRLAIVVLSLAGCTRNNPNAFVCTPGEQRECACIGGTKGIQICNPGGDLLSDCLGCPGGPQLDLSFPFGTDLATNLPDLTFVPQFDFPPGTDLTGFNPFADFSLPPEDLSIPDVLPRCPIVMLAFDNSGSMATAFPQSGAPSHLDGAKNALNRLVDRYGGRVPFGLTRFENSSGTCDDGVQIVVPPMSGTSAAVKSGVNAAMAGGTTNTGNTMQSIAAEPAMHDPGRMGSFVVLVTDGAANCDANDPDFSATIVGQIASASQPIKTYVVGIDLPDFDQPGVDSIASAGQKSCQGGFCSGHSYYPADSEAQLDKALDLVVNDIVASVPGCGGFNCFPSGAACGVGTTCCGVVGCKNLQNDPQNCGQCATVCASNSCIAGHCSGVDMSLPDLQQPDLRPPADLRPANDLRPATDLRQVDLQSNNDLDMRPPCVCGADCVFGCVGTNCCGEWVIGNICSPTPDTCACSGTGCI